MSIKRILCKYLDRDKKGYVNIIDIINPIIMVTLIVVFLSMYITGGYFTFTVEEGEEGVYMVLSILLFIFINVVIVVASLVSVLTLICKNWEKIKDKRIVVCKIDNGDE